jgi:hypothetical protein
MFSRGKRFACLLPPLASVGSIGELFRTRLIKGQESAAEGRPMDGLDCRFRKLPGASRCFTGSNHRHSRRQPGFPPPATRLPRPYAGQRRTRRTNELPGTPAGGRGAGDPSSCFFLDVPKNILSRKADPRQYLQSAFRYNTAGDSLVAVRRISSQ